MIEIQVNENFRAGFATDIWITNKVDGHRQFLQPDGNWIAVDLSEYAAVLDDSIKPTMRLPMDLAKELLQALTAHYHGADDARSLRRDYDAERERTDNMFKEYALLANHALSTIDMAADMAASAGVR